ncbi:Hypothetical predicted protein [Olea europaea subsp. europaea]|uniref:CBF1-interacting co-repressor CIR N-terminal domain-containing protein n=1 Tax=Olea europaea subsp. europaea TaxID=158383 RepID=A0A8S0SW54_OLEEU|nr:Hypothetical predicted protein [Olea europaea subsp. europaea]
MGGNGGLNILPQKRWNVYNYENREKVKQDEEATAKEEQLKREQARKRDAESRLKLAALEPEDEKYKLGYGVAGKGVKLSWYMDKRISGNVDEKNGDEKLKVNKKSGGKKTVEESREERLKRERKEKERERALIVEKSRKDGGFS